MKQRTKRHIDIAALALATVVVMTGCTSQAATKTASPSVSASTAPAAGGLVLDTTKAYGDKYADGLLPVGDGKYSGTTPAVGTIFVCNANFPANAPGAQARGPWFVNNNTQWNINLKPAVSGSISWEPKLSIAVSGSTRTITTNDLPIHKTGQFPIVSTDPASKYDRNPNSISSQSLSYALPASPTYGDPQCVGGEIGVMTTGVALFDGFDAGGRDAGAWEVQDSCDGHPQDHGEYHYHTLSSCISDQSVTTVIGWALDGFPITGPTVSTGNVLTTADLDVCHGLTSSVTIDGKQVTTYHYVMTEDFPYSASCFRAKATNAPR